MSLARYAGTALRVFDAMSDAANGKPVWVYGQSFGTVAALHFAANRPLDWQVLRNVTPAREMLHAHTPRGLRWAARWEARGIPGTLDVSRIAAKSKNAVCF